MGGWKKKRTDTNLERRQKAFDAQTKKHAGMKRPGSSKK